MRTISKFQVTSVEAIRIAFLPSPAAVIPVMIKLRPDLWRQHPDRGRDCSQAHPSWLPQVEII